jgi:protein pelota
MKILHKDLRKGNVKLLVETLDDLWYLSHIITEGDQVSGKSHRKIKIGDGENAKVVKKPFFLKIEVEKVEFHRYSDVLRVSGKVIEGPEEVTTGSYHTFNLQEGTDFSLHKNEFLSYQIAKLEEAASGGKVSVLLVALDREEAFFAVLKKYGYEVLGHISGNVAKKDFEQQSSNFYREIKKAIDDYDTRYKFESIVIASPAFFKEDFMKEASDIKDKVTLATISSVDKGCFNELLKREEVKTVLQKDKISKEVKIVDRLMAEISKDADGKAAYGIDETSDAVNMGAVETLLVTDGFIFKMREEGNYKALDTIMQIADRAKAKINIISSEHEGGKQLDGLGGIGAILRYRI